MTIPARKLEFLPTKVSGRVRPYVDNDVPDTTSNATYNLHFAVRLPLKMHSSDSPFLRRVRKAVLRETGLKIVDREFVNTKGSDKVATIVANWL